MKIELGNFKFELGRKSVSPEMSAWMRGDDVSDNDRGAKLTSPYSQSSWVYIAISVLAENVAQIPLRISRVPQSAAAKLARGADARFKKRVLGENIIESGEVVDLFAVPHPTMDRALFWANIVSWKALRGEFFVVPLDNYDQPIDLESRGGKVKRMLALEPGMFWHIVRGYELDGWRYTGSPLLSPLPSETLLPSEVIHHRTFNPYLYWRGLSPLILATLAAMTDYAASQFMKGLMTNNADTGVIITTDQQVGEQQREQILAALRERKRKAGTADRPLFLWGGAKMEKPTLSNADMEFLANRKFNREEIFAVFKVPPSMAGIEDSNSRSMGGGGGSQQQDRRVFIENTVTNFCRQLESAFTPIAKRFDPSLELWFDIDSLPIMQEARRDRLDAAGKAFGMGAPFNDINQIYDLGFPEYPWGENGYLPFNLQEAGTATPDDEPGDDPNDPGNPEEASADPIERARKFFQGLGHRGAEPQRPKQTHVCGPNPAFEQSIAGSIKNKKGKLSKFFFEQRGRVLSKLAELKSQKTVTKAIDDLWNPEDENQKLIAKLKPLLINDLEFGGAQVYEEISSGVDFNLAPKDAIAFLAKREPVIQDINDTTWAALKAQLQEGLAAGESFDTLADRVRTVFDAASGARADVIALTETTVATNSGRYQAMLDAGVERKGWRTSHLENTRTTHLLNEELSDAENGIPIDQDWPNGCAYPGDPDGAPGETINCRCFGYAVKAGKSKTLLRFEEWSAAKAMKGGTR